MNNLQLTELLPVVKHFNGQRVVTFSDIDVAHNRPAGTARKRYNSNKRHFLLGIDYFVRNTDEAKREYNIIAPNGLTLITESGYLMIVKSFTDDLSWQVQRMLVNSYFRFKEEVLLPDSEAKTEVVPVTHTYSPLPEGTISNPIGTLEVLLSFAREKKLKVKSLAFKAYYSRLKGNRICVATNLTVEHVCYEVAYELAHAMLHSDAGDIMNSRYQEEYNLRAHNAALMLLSVIEHSANIL